MKRTGRSIAPSLVPSPSRWPARSAGAGASLALASGWGTPARAQHTWNNDASVFLSYDFGGDRAPQFGFGVEARRIYDPRPSCGDPDPGGYAGIAGRVLFLGWDQLRVLAAPQMGWMRPDPITSIGGEIGVGLRVGRDSGWFLQPGFEVGLFTPLVVRAGITLGRNRESHALTSAGAGDLVGRFMLGPNPFPSMCAVGRPLRRGAGLAPLPLAVIDGEAWKEGKRGEAARVWAARACTEWASVPAFFELAEQLAACSAPPALGRKALAAAEDETRHAFQAARIAATLSGAHVALEPPVLVPRDPVIGRAGLLRLGIESWVDGCIAEGAAAACATAEAEVAEVGPIRAAQRAIAADETRHAELGWEILAWSLSLADHETRAEIRAGISGRTQQQSSAPVHGALDAFGCLSPAAQERVARVHGVQASARRDALFDTFPA